MSNEDSRYQYYAIKTFKNSKKGKLLFSIEVFLLSFVLASLFYLLISDDLKSSPIQLKISFFGLCQTVSFCIMVIVSVVHGGSFFVQKFFPPTDDEIISYKAKRRDELYEALKELKSSYIRNKRWYEGELNNLL